jgi:hypothetical protein
VSGQAVKLLSGPAGYAVPMVVGLVAVYLVYQWLKAPAAAVGAAATSVYTGLQNFDANTGAAPFDAWVSGLFAPPTVPVSPNLGANTDMGGSNFGTTGLGW